ncbi:MAG TPA: c-type cytochrome [Methylophilaceae bacterium]|nr:c-type cytochrome [Methylophilaceae bacterium]HQR60424.1 c-type cytochrome [Methylophilaceae bacterium]
MSTQHHDFPKTTVLQFILALLGGLLMPGLVIFLIVKLVLGIQATHIEDTDPAIAAARVVERIQPVGQVNLADSSGPRVDKSGEQVVKEVCAMCHAAGLLGSPKIGDKSAWAPRLSQGYDTLVKHALEGIRQMPARGGAADLSDGEVAAAVAYMANQSGASFKTPEPARAEAEVARK